MSNPIKLAEFKVPGGSAGPQDLPAPSGIPRALQGGLADSGAAFFQTIINNLILLGSFFTIVMIMVAGIQWITSRGEPEKIASAKKRFFYALIGLIVMLSAFFIVRVIIFVTGGNWQEFMNPASMLQDSPAP